MQTFDPSHYNQSQVSTNHLPVKKRRKKKEAHKISAMELREKMKEAEARFIQPKPFAELDGKPGVSLSDMSISLNITHSDLKRKVERSGTIEYLRALNYSIKTYVFFTAANRAVESYVMDVMAAQHIVGSYDNLAGWYYRDFLIRSKDALKVSLEVLQKTESTLIKAQVDLSEAKQKIDILTQPKITRRNNIVFKEIVAEKSSLFHDTTYKVKRELIKQPKKEDEVYQEYYLQKLAKITKGNIESMLSALDKLNCNREVLNKRMDQLSRFSDDVNTLINPDDEDEYNSLVKQIERERE